MSKYILQMLGIEKSFGSNKVLKDIDFSLEKGEIHALLGENGAGKSTLMNILGGVIKADKGEVIIEENSIVVESPSMAQNLGIGFIHQELNSVNHLKVYENLFLGREIKNRFGILDKKKMIEETKRVLELLSVDIDPQEYVIELDTAYKQLVEIGRVILQKSNIIIMDEPTTSLTDHEIEYLFKVMKQLKENGVSIIFISHKLKEVISVCDRYTILRDGKLIESDLIDKNKITEEYLAMLFVGNDIAEDKFYKSRNLGQEILRIENYSNKNLFKDISFTLKKGEILGFTGLLGDGRNELFESIFGYRNKSQGKMFINGKEVNVNHPSKASSLGIGYVPRNRKENAIIKDFTVFKNFTISNLNRFKKGILIDENREKETCNKYKNELNIKAHDITFPITSLSGGNQQKVILARWIEAASDILILDNPTQGIDIGAKAEIYHLIMSMAKEGKSIIVLSSEIPELLKICDRIAIMYHGKINKILDRNEASEEKVMIYATDAKKDMGVI